MRNNSPTGGALGQVVERELQRLENTVASLDPGQTEDQIRGNVKKIRDYIIGREQRMQEAFDLDYGDIAVDFDKNRTSVTGIGDVPPATDPATAPSGQQIIDPNAPIDDIVNQLLNRPPAGR
jgi:hypothetical protein